MRLAGLLAVIVFPLGGVASPAGISGFSGKAGSAICTSCHTGGADPTVAVSGPATVGVGAIASYTVTITGAPGVNAGLDGALSGANSGSASLVPGPGTRLLNGELVHSAAKLFSGGTATFTFSLRAPLTPGPLILTVAGLSSDNSNDPSGDGAATTSLTVEVSLTGGAADAGGAPGLIGVTAPASSADGGAKAPAAHRYYGPPQSSGVIEGESGCSSGGGLPMVVLVGLVGGALLRRPRALPPTGAIRSWARDPPTGAIRNRARAAPTGALKEAASPDEGDRAPTR